jgi:membrane-associated protein
MDVIKQIVDYFLHLDRYLAQVINACGLWTYGVLFAIVFCETGLVILPFLPGDSLLFAAGALTATTSLQLGWMVVLLSVAAIIGDAVSYQIGKRAGPMLFNRPKSRFFNPDHIKAAHDFYEKHGGKAIVIARFMPLVRTFVPVVAGIAGMGYRRFASYNIIGGAAWIASMTCLGYFLGGIAEKAGFPLEKHIEKVIIVVVFLSILPGIIAWWKNRRAEAAPPPSA